MQGEKLILAVDSSVVDITFQRGIVVGTLAACATGHSIDQRITTTTLFSKLVPCYATNADARWSEPCWSEPCWRLQWSSGWYGVMASVVPVRRCDAVQPGSSALLRAGPPPGRSPPDHSQRGGVA